MSLVIVSITNNYFLTIVLLALVSGNVGRYIARRYEDEVDEYALNQIGFERAKKGIQAFHRSVGSNDNE